MRREAAERRQLTQDFAAELTRLRATAGMPSFRTMAGRSGSISHTTLHEAAYGSRFPTWETVREFVRACGGDEASWRVRWERTREQLGTSVPDRQPVSAPPLQLPADLPDFTGRDEELAVLVKDPARIMVICGQPGSGKTALAVHAAHLMRDRFPHGVLYCDLNESGHAQDPDEVLTGFLRSLGVDGQAIPPTAAERSGLYRSLLADRTVLIVLDNATASTQVRPLLPPSPTAGTLVASRVQLAGLAGANHLTVGAMSPTEARELLTLAAGRGRLPDSADLVTAACGHLPLAIRICGARLATRPQWTVDHLAERLDDVARRLDELKVDDLNVRECIAFSYGGLSESAARAFRLLGLANLATPSVETAAALIGDTPAATESILEELLDSHLVSSPETRRYAMHNLLQTFAAERCRSADPTLERTEALTRVINSLLRTLATLSPHPRHPKPAAEDGPARFEAERATLLSAIALAGATPELGSPPAADLLELMQRPLIRTGRWADLERSARTVQAAAARDGDRRSAAVAQRALGRVLMERREFERAEVLLAGSLDYARTAEDKIGEAGSLIALGTLRGRTGAHEAAVDLAEEAVTITVANDIPIVEALARNTAAQHHLRLGRPGPALTHLTTSFELCRRLADEDLLSMTYYLLGQTHSRLGDHDQALGYLWEALDRTRAAGSAYSESIALSHLGRVLAAAGEHTEARLAFEAAAALQRRDPAARPE